MARRKLPMLGKILPHPDYWGIFRSCRDYNGCCVNPFNQEGRVCTAISGRPTGACYTA
ncbi:hypothetical protein SERLA73DRAFT_185406 [Serpula lacrymans var. lacrymans S7.3]|uniref:Uncharacterized protein n=2 Tax=Serpula lacrymans var. lacrymans TaxID=341189 RepID=F8Q5R8_SERL3|nr:uncharacterized protein SERLADRAFT_473882 [Serpula lacrymans var. lacrymans S7.9]EGN95956.1 hypothetical protein SERLA73DRAFT_185406 [Serpula lacrymans var. lacrymans S7.3]EGO21479.1 hypothetical protein SERLADRAFT_473882 [Serpula lacrymans var. lacrymans S7.9]